MFLRFDFLIYCQLKIDIYEIVNPLKYKIREFIFILACKLKVETVPRVAILYKLGRTY